jgi:hypothetical protein
MANPEHLKILKQGVGAWNKWRIEVHTIRPDLGSADLLGEDLIGADLGGANLAYATLAYANLAQSNLIGARLRRAALAGAMLTNANLGSADLLGANFDGANLDGANLANATLTNARLAKASLTNANLGRASLTNADFLNARMDATVLVNVDLSEVKNLESVIHFGPSSVGIDTIYKSSGNIPEKFLRGCGVPENFITYMHSLTVEGIEFYTCFISFTEADDTFSERLYNDMQGAGVRCWRWKEDAKWGRTLMHSIDEAVRVYDKLIVICSEQSLNSPAVIREIERALQKEDAAAREGKEAEVLFPIRLDDYIFTGWQHHRQADVVAKNVGDFRQWTEPESYKKALQRLIRDLKAEARKQ